MLSSVTINVDGARRQAARVIDDLVMRRDVRDITMLIEFCGTEHRAVAASEA